MAVNAGYHEDVTGFTESKKAPRQAVMGLGDEL